MTFPGDQRWPAPTVIGVLSTGDLTFLPEAYAIGAAAELDDWREVSTWGKARDLAGQATFVAPPFAVEDLGDDENGDAVFAVDDLGMVSDGDWPPAAQTLSLELVRDQWPDGQSLDVGEVHDTVLNGPVLVIHPDEEEALRQALERAGCTVRRDDALVRRAGEV